MNSKVSDYASIAGELEEYGLTHSQASIYLALLTSGRLDVRSICADTRFHRSDVYRNVKALERIGVIETAVGPPTRYSAVEPSVALGLLNKLLKSKHDALVKKSEDLSSRLDSFKAPTSKLETPESTASQSTFSLIVGRQRYWHETKLLVEQSKRDIVRILDSQGLKTMAGSELFEDFIQAAKRGVKIRIIAEVTPYNFREALLCARHFDIKHLHSIVLRFIEVDSTSVILCGSLDRTDSDEELTHNRFLRFRDKNFAESLKFFFSELWEIAKPIDSFKLPVEQKIPPAFDY